MPRPADLCTILRLHDGGWPYAGAPLPEPIIVVEAEPWSDVTLRALAASSAVILRNYGPPTLADALSYAGDSLACLFVDSRFSIFPAAIPALLAAAAPIAFADEVGFHKPAWNLDLALEQDLIGGLCLIRRGLLAARPHLPIEAPHDTVLRLADLSPGITLSAHAAGEWRRARRAQPCPAAVQAALAAIPRDRSQPRMIPSSLRQALFRIEWRPIAPAPLVSIVIPTKDNPAMLRRCVDGILNHTDYAPVEVIIADNGAVKPEGRRVLDDLAQDQRIRIVRVPGPFNYAHINNVAVVASRGDVVVLMNDDVDVIAPNWLAEMVGHALRPGIGIVGAKLLYPDDSVQHAGIVLGVGSFEGGPGIAGHFGLTAAAAAPGYAAQLVTTREVSAVTAACLALRRDVWELLGGMDAANLPVALNDLDLCLRAREAGLRVVWTPFALLHHHESASRGADLGGPARDRFAAECRYIDGRWRSVLDADPFYNPNFSRYDHSFRPARP